MRIKRSLTLAFLLVLYIGPSLFALSYASSAILTEPNMTKDFQLSTTPWLSGWTYRKSVNINGSSGAGTNYPVLLNVTYDSDMNIDFSDIRFTDNDKITELDYWIESKTNSTFAEVWVEFTDNLDTAQTGYMYYGNIGASTTSEGADVFLFFDDFEDNDLTAWPMSGANWGTTSAQKKYGSYSVFGNADATDRELYIDGLDIETDLMMHAWSRMVLDNSQEYIFYGEDMQADPLYALASTVNDWTVYDGTAWREYEANTQTADTWFRCEVALDITNDYWRFYRDREEKQEWALKDGSGTAVTGIERMGSITSATDGVDLWLDDYYIRNWVYDEPDFDSFGEEETISWQVVGEADLVFNIAIDETGLNMLLVFLGLCMIPASTLYAVKGGLKEASTDKLFFFMVIFLIGWALILGGIYA